MKFDINYINDLIDKKAEESLKLEFKRGDSIADRKEMSKDISSMANSAGGVIIYGIEEADHIASKPSYINGNEYTKEWLENVIDSNIHRKIDNLIIYPIREDDDINKTIYIIEVPESQNSPHISKDGKYYKRHNFKNLPMEEYEIRSLYFKSLNPELVFDNLLLTKNYYTEEKKGVEQLYCSPIFQILNKGKGVSIHHKVILHINRKYNASFSLDVLRSKNVISEGLIDKDTISISIYDKTPILPDEIFSISRFNLCFPKKFIIQNKAEEEGAEIKVEIAYQGGRDIVSLYINDFYPTEFIDEFL